jgi:CheY-like chemotaxis protein
MRIFEPFTQGDTSAARSRGGLGVGLGLVRTLVELHGGSVSAHSAGRGRGSTFEVRLPLALSPAPAAGSTLSAPSPARMRRILIIEDDRDAREVLQVVLELDGHRVETAPNGVIGVRMAAATAPDIVLVDIGLPEVDGYEVARRIRKRLGKAVQLIALTGYGDPQARSAALEAGFDAHLVKPVTPEDLARVLG